MESGNDTATVQRRRRRGGRVLRRVALAAAGLLLGLSVYSANARLVIGEQLPMPFGVGLAAVVSGSMEPALHVNDLVVVREADDMQVGDIVVYQEGSHLVVHRTVIVTSDTLVTRGDANPVDDAPIFRSAVKGVVDGRIPALGALVQALRTPAGIMFALAVAFVLALASFRVGERRGEADEGQLDAMRDEIARLRAQVEAKEGYRQ